MEARNLQVVRTTKAVSVIVALNVHSSFNDDGSYMMHGEIINNLVAQETICPAYLDCERWGKLTNKTKAEINQYAFNEFKKLC